MCPLKAFETLDPGPLKQPPPGPLYELPEQSWSYRHLPAKRSVSITTYLIDVSRHIHLQQMQLTLPARQGWRGGSYIILYVYVGENIFVEGTCILSKGACVTWTLIPTFSTIFLQKILIKSQGRYREGGYTGRREFPQYDNKGQNGPKRPKNGHFGPKNAPMALKFHTCILMVFSDSQNFSEKY